MTSEWFDPLFSGWLFSGWSFSGWSGALAAARGGFLFLSILVSSPVTAEVYRWVDENGNVHFSDEPREGADAVELAPVPTQPDSEADLARQRHNAEWFAEQRQRRERAESEREAREKRQRAARAKGLKQCKKATARLADKQAELAARKRAGIKPKTETRLKLKIERLRAQAQREC